MVWSEKPSPFVFASSTGRDGRPFPPSWSYVNVEAKRPLLPAFPSASLLPGNGSRTFLCLYRPEELVGLSREGAQLPCSPRAPGAGEPGTPGPGRVCALPVLLGLACGHKQPLSTSSPLPKWGGRKGALTVPQAGNSTPHREEPSPPGS